MARPRSVDADRICTALRLPRDLHARLSAAADERGVGLNWLIVRLLDESMERLIPVSELLLTASVRPAPTEPEPGDPGYYEACGGECRDESAPTEGGE